MECFITRSYEEQKKLEMIYLANDEQLSQRVIRVLAIQDNLILAYCYSRNQIRTFKKKNVMSVYPYKPKKKVGA
ncbi:hypothetical protein MUO14_12865 [Halobacillus shinanisalinarum]|uniref:WYL domain-containing protein n=1 Tax=Halobacillus shinanisalinarum TaxID=2932258 RepID=A0ABY4GU60_9BACI|nr:hypothetical protein [Halobacillus shinanisalinarum]UOQ91476.1 hypothetical protein MUO14_12865 [Halobacillus shinanisalinarum]